MTIVGFQRFFAPIPPRKSDRIWHFWLSLSLGFAVVCGWLALKQGFSGEWIVQDDARQHVFWMLRYLDPQLYPNDLIADYFQSVAPVGYTTLYKLAATLGINPLVFNKLLPTVIGFISTWYAFLLCKQIFPLPLGCFISTLLLNQNLWLKDDIISGTPRAFVYPFFLAFLYYFAKRSLIPCGVAIALLGIFYPQCVFLASGMLILQLFEWEGIRPTLSRKRNDYYFCFIGLAVAFVVMLPYALNVSEYAPTITRQEALELPDFYAKGRSKFFKDSFWGYIFGGGRGGLLPSSLYDPYTLVFAVFLPIIIRFKDKFPLLKEITHKIWLVLHLIVVSVVMFILAHAVLFKLHLPSRYTGHSFRIVLSVAAGIVLTSILDALWRKVKIGQNSFKIGIIGQKIVSGFLAAAIAIAIVFYPSFVKEFPDNSYKIGNAQALYQFFQQQPKDIMIASLVLEADNLPTFTKRSILVSREYAIPYHLGYYRPYRQRVIDLITAQYSTDIEVVKEFIRKYNITFWLLDEGSFIADYVHDNNWIRQHEPTAQEAIASLRQGNIPALMGYKDSCAVFAEGGFTVISAECVLQRILN